MRQIKFRAWNKATNEYELLNDWLINSEGEVVNIRMGDDAFTVAAHDLILEQLTGLLDKNGKEIYEGDVVKCWDESGEEDAHICQVKDMTDDEYPAFDIVPNPVDDMCNGLSYFKATGSIEIIGNIHQNPELFGKEAPHV